MQSNENVFSHKVNMRKWHHKQLDLRPLESIPYVHPRSNFVVMCRVFRIARVDMHWQLASLKLACHRFVTGNESRYLQGVFICHLNMHQCSQARTQCTTLLHVLYQNLTKGIYVTRPPNGRSSVVVYSRTRLWSKRNSGIELHVATAKDWHPPPPLMMKSFQWCFMTSNSF